MFCARNAREDAWRVAPARRDVGFNYGMDDRLNPEGIRNPPSLYSGAPENAKGGEPCRVRIGREPDRQRPSLQKHALTDFQETVCNLAADLILNGGTEANVSNLLHATPGHSLQLRFQDHDSWREDHIERDLPEWQRRISRYWPAKADPVEPEHELPNTVTGMLRANLRGKLEEKFTEFLAKSRMHELYLMCGVLENFEQNSGGPDNDKAESALAEAFAYELASDDTYVKVPRDRVALVEDFLATMDSIPDVDEPAPAGRPKLVVFPERQPSPEVNHAS